MDNSRVARIIEAIGTTGGLDPATYPKQVCEAAVRILGLSGAGLTLMSEAITVGDVWASNDLAQAAEDLQFTLGEGPALDAFHLRTPMLEPNLADSYVRWTFFSPQALDLGILAAFSFPLQMGAIRFGALNLFHDERGFLSAEQLADALVLADIATQDIIDLQAEGSFLSPKSDHLSLRAQVHQATGMIAAQIDSDMAGALARIRAHAFAFDLSIFEVAEQVLSRRLRLQESSDD